MEYFSSVKSCVVIIGNTMCSSKYFPLGGNGRRALMAKQLVGLRSRSLAVGCCRNVQGYCEQFQDKKKKRKQVWFTVPEIVILKELKPMSKSVVIGAFRRMRGDPQKWV